MINLIGIVVKKEYLNDRMVELGLELQEPVPFKAGQHVQFFINGQPRAYSMCSSPTQPKVWEFCVELLEKGLGSDYVRNLKIGDKVNFRGPVGSFVIDNMDEDICFIATGVGVAPFKSMLEDLYQKKYKGNCTLIYGNRNEQDILYRDYWEELSKSQEGFHFIPVLSRHENPEYKYNGRVQTYVDQLYSTMKDRTFYICGNMDMVQETKDLLLSKGHPIEKIKQDIFLYVS